LVVLVLVYKELLNQKMKQLAGLLHSRTWHIKSNKASII